MSVIEIWNGAELKQSVSWDDKANSNPIEDLIHINSLRKKNVYMNRETFNLIGCSNKYTDYCDCFCINTVRNILEENDCGGLFVFDEGFVDKKFNFKLYVPYGVVLIMDGNEMSGICVGQ